MKAPKPNSSLQRKIKVFFLITLLRDKIQKIIFLLLPILLFIISLRIITDPNSDFKSKSDFEDYYNASIRLKSFQNPYYIEKIESIFNQKDTTIKTFDDLKKLLEDAKGVGKYLYPPLFAFLLIPLTFFPYTIAAILYQIIQITFLMLSFYLLYKTLEILFPKTSNRKINFSILLGFFMLLPLHVQNISNGNVGFLLIFLVSLSLFLYFKNFQNSFFADFINGLIIGIATIIKVLPGFLMGFYFIKRKYIIFIGFLFGIIIGIFLPALYLGWEINVRYFTDWYEWILVNYKKYSVLRPYANNQTISAALVKLFIPYADLNQILYELPFSLFQNQLGIVGSLIQGINLFLLINLAVLTLLFFFKRTNTIFFLYYSYILFLTALLTSGISWYHTFSILFPVYVFFCILWIEKFQIKTYIFFVPSLFLWFLWFLPYKLKDFFSMYSFFLWLNLGIFIYLLITLYNAFFKNGILYEK
ncbi:MAG: glycosyltransferase family 87 protein [Leptonema sp. (in: bacteria)]